MTERVTADRLVLVSVVDHWSCLREPTFVGAGQTYWIDDETRALCVDRGDGRMTRHVRSDRTASTPR